MQVPLAATHGAQPQPAHPPSAGAASLPSARHVSTDASLQAACIAWGHLQPADRKAIRASCRGGRLQHDRLLTHLQLTLGATRPQEAADAGYGNGHNNENNMINIAHGSPTAEQIRASLQAVVARGARLGSLTVYFTDGGDGSGDAQLHAALAACSGCPLSRLVLEGAVPLTGSTAEAVLACCPHVTSLTLDHERYGGALVRGESAEAPNEADHAEYQYGCIELLSRCGPRLTHLRLWGMDRWPALLYKYVQRCTALASLELGARRADPYSERTRVAETLAIESTVYASVAQLTGLRSLHLSLHAERRTAMCSGADLRPHAAHLAHLSSLTALTHLRLELDRCYQHTHDSWYQNQEEEEVWHAGRCEVRESHRTTLLSVLGRMQQLQHLHCPTLWLTPSEAASLAALTGLHLGGLLPFADGGQAPQARTAGGSSGRSTCLPVSSPWALPPLLRELHLHDAASPRLLASLQLPSSLLRLNVNSISFGMSDMAEEDGRLTQEAVLAVGPVVRRLVRYRGNGGGRGRITIDGDGSSSMTLPREGSPDGHMEWIRQLQGLDGVVGHLTLNKMALSAEDLGCVGTTLPNLKSLKVWGSTFPVVALPIMRHQMTQLTHLELDLADHCSMDQHQLASVLLQLCRPHPGAEQLKHLKWHVFGDWELSDADKEACRRTVLQQLASSYGVTGVEVTISGVLQLPEDDPEMWKAILRVLMPSSFVADLVTWDNVEPLLLMADKYDIAVIRGHCCHFLATHVSETDFAQPLESPRNVLRAASLACMYGSSKAQDMLPYSKTCIKAVDGALTKIMTFAHACNCSVSSSRIAVCPKCHFGFTPILYLVDNAQTVRLRELVKDPRYPTLIVHEVQTAVTCAIFHTMRTGELSGQE